MTYVRGIPSHLSSSVAILPGYAERSSRSLGRGEFRIVQGRDVDPAGRIAWSQLERCDAAPGAERASLRAYDVLVTTRTTAPRSILVDNPPAKTCVSGQFVILRPDPRVVDPVYLAWLLNSGPTRARLRASFRGSTMPFLAAKDLAAFEIAVPPLDRQRAIVRVLMLRQQLAALGARLDRSLDLLLDAVTRGASS